jgi:hypothetical protein
MSFRSEGETNDPPHFHEGCVQARGELEAEATSKRRIPQGSRRITIQVRPGAMATDDDDQERVDSGSVEFSDREVKLISRSLPDGVDQRRMDLLPEILREWGQTDLREHLSGKPRAITRNRLGRLSRVAKCAAELLQALDGLNDRDRAHLALEIGSTEEATLWQVDFAEQEKRLDEARDFLTALAATGSKAHWKRRPGQPRNITSYLIMMDLAALYEYLTGWKAIRSVDRRTREESGAFWQFAAAVWPVAFGSDDGLPAAMKSWANARKKYNEESPLVANIAFRHPTWGIFD